MQKPPPGWEIKQTGGQKSEKIFYVADNIDPDDSVSRRYRNRIFLI